MAVSGPDLALDVANGQVWRVGFTPDPWAWPPRDLATYAGRWDSPDHSYRTIYAGETLLSCLLEVLAVFRPDTVVADGLDDIVEEDEDAAFPTVQPGSLDPAWLDERIAGSAHLNGVHCSVTAASTIALLRQHFISQAHSMGLLDFDAAALKDGRNRELTQLVSRFLYERTGVDGIRFASRLGDELKMWALFEREDNTPTSTKLSSMSPHKLTVDDPDVAEAFAHLGLRWLDPADDSSS